MIALTTRSLSPFNSSNLTFSPISSSSVILAPSSPEDALGTEDPRVVYDDSTRTYYLMYTSVAQGSNGDVSAYLSLATATSAPTSADGWTKRGYLFPQLSWSKSGEIDFLRYSQILLIFFLPSVHLSRSHRRSPYPGHASLPSLLGGQHPRGRPPGRQDV